jgi:hypothetical protein
MMKRFAGRLAVQERVLGGFKPMGEDYLTL